MKAYRQGSGYLQRYELIIAKKFRSWPQGNMA
jgi:hypothetical protein